MYRLENKNHFPIYLDWAEHAPGASPNGAVPVAEMRPRIKVADKLDAAMRVNAEFVALEDAEFTTLKECASRAAYMGVNRDAVAAADALEKAVKST